MVGVRNARKTDAWRVAVEAIWRTTPRRGLAMNSLRLGVKAGGELSCVMACVSRFATGSRGRESGGGGMEGRDGWVVEGGEGVEAERERGGPAVVRGEGFAEAAEEALAGGRVG